MKILVSSPAFLPNLGGLEIVTDQLATLWAQAGHEVAVVTRTPGTPQDAPYRVLRNPSPLKLLGEMRRCDLYCQQNVSLREVWPLFFVPRPWVVIHQSWYTQTDGSVTWKDRLKRYLSKRAACSIAASRALAQDVGGGTIVIENSYRDQLFRQLPGTTRKDGIVFVGRLVSDKGVDVLLDALAELRAKGRSPSLSIVGEGPELERLLQQADRLGLAQQVRFLGSQRDYELVRTINRHEILIVPSRYREPFGIVALEGIACGCAVVGSAGGGLVDAIGPCGKTFPNGDIASLAATLEELIVNKGVIADCLARAPAHLDLHRGQSVADRYIEEFRRILR